MTEVFTVTSMLSVAALIAAPRMFSMRCWLFVSAITLAQIVSLFAVRTL